MPRKWIDVWYHDKGIGGKVPEKIASFKHRGDAENFIFSISISPIPASLTLMQGKIILKQIDTKGEKRNGDVKENQG